MTLSPDNRSRAELARLLSAGSPSRRLLRQRAELFVALGVALGALHLAAGRGGGDHVALTAMLSALIPVFAPVCFVPVVFADRERGHAGTAVMAVRLGVVAGLGWVVTGVHLAVWEVLAAATGSIGGPSGGDVPFMVLTVVVTAVVATAAFELPARERWAEPATVLVVVVLYAASFVVHAQLLSPTMAAIRARAPGGQVAVELAAVAVSLTVVWLLMRREVSDGSRKAASVAVAPLPDEASAAGTARP